MLKLLADMGIITMETSSAQHGSLADVLAGVRTRSKPALSMDEIVAVVKDVRAKHRIGGRKKAPR